MKGVLKYELDVIDIGGPVLFKKFFFLSLMKSPLTIRSKQTRALVKGRIRFYIYLKTYFLMRMTL